jgi:hypothetical protein
MKFVVEQAGRAGERAGQLELAARTFATPLPLLHSRGGAIPHLTQETLLYLENSGTVCTGRHLKYSVGSALILSPGFGSVLGMRIRIQEQVN